MAISRLPNPHARKSKTGFHESTPLMMAHSPRRPRRRVPSRWLAVGAVLVLMLITGLSCKPSEGSHEKSSASQPQSIFDSSQRAEELMRRVIALAPPPVGRLSLSPTEEVTAFSRRPNVLGFGSSSDLAEMAHAVYAVEELADRSELPADRLHLLGLARAAEGRMDEAMLLIEGACLEEPQRTAGWSDLAAIGLSRFEGTADPRDLLKALAAAEEALNLEEGFPPALVNRAEALTRLHIRMQAEDAWRAVLASEPSGDWVERAEAALAELRQPTLEERWVVERKRLLNTSLTDRQLAGLVREYPHSIRMLVVEELFPQWSRAQIEGSAGAAEEALALARRLGGLLLEQTEDRLISDAVDAVEEARTHGQEADLAALAHRYGSLGRGVDLYYSKRFDQSRIALQDVLPAAPSEATPISALATFYLASIEHYEDPAAAASALLRIQEFPAASYPLLHGFSDWVLGTIESITGDSRIALRHYASARGHLERSASDRSLGALHPLLGDSYRLLGDESAAWREYLSGLRWAAASGNVRRYHVALYTTTEAIFDFGDPAMARSFGDELVQNATLSNDPFRLAEAFLQRGRIHDALDAPELARRDYRRARAYSRRIESHSLKDRASATAALAEAEALVDRAPEQATLALSRTIESKLRNGYLYQLPRALLARGRAHLARGDLESADIDFIAAIEEQSQEEGDEIRGAYLRASRGLLQDAYDASVALNVLLRGDINRGFSLVERSRRSTGRRGTGIDDITLAPMEIARRLPAGVVLVEYAQLPSALVIWVISSGETEAVVQELSRSDLEHRVALLRNVVRRGGTVGEFNRASAALFDVLVRPVASLLFEANSLIVIPDEMTAAVPVGALFDDRQGRYLIQDFAVAVSPSATDAVWKAPADNAVGIPDRDLLGIADPAIDRERHLDLVRLPRAEAEVEGLAQLYPTRLALVGPQATEEAFVREAVRSRVVHFAGHSRFHPTRRELTALLFAPSSDADGMLTVAEMGQLDLRTTNLVVLSSCGDGGGSFRGAPAADERVEAFLSAGADAVLTSLWPVQDRAAAAFMKSFHQSSATGASAAESYRAAALAMLSQDSTRLAGPQAWAAFALFVGQWSEPGPLLEGAKGES